MRRNVLAVMAAAMVVLGLNMGVRQTFGLFMDPMFASLEISWASFSLAMAVQNVLWGALTPVCGYLADRFGAGRVLAFGGVAYAAGLVVMATAQTAVGLHVGAGALVGVAVAATGFPLVLGVVAKAVSENRRSVALGLASAGGSVGQFLLLPGTQAMIESVGWETALLTLAGMAALMVPLAAALASKPSEGEDDDARPMDAVRDAWDDGSFRLLTFGFFVCGFHVAFIATHLPGYVSTCSLAPMVGAGALGLIGLFNIVGVSLAGVLGGRYPMQRLLSGLYLARAVVIAAFLAAPKTEEAVWVFSAAFGLLWLSTVPLTSGLIGKRFGPRYMATLFGVVMFSHQVGAFFGAWTGGLSLQYTGGYELVWGIAVALGVGAAALHWPISDARHPTLAREQAA